MAGCDIFVVRVCFCFLFSYSGHSLAIMCLMILSRSSSYIKWYIKLSQLIHNDIQQKYWNKSYELLHPAECVIWTVFVCIVPEALKQNKSKICKRIVSFLLIYLKINCAAHTVPLHCVGTNRNHRCFVNVIWQLRN